MALATRQQLGQTSLAPLMERTASALSAASNVFLSHSSKEPAATLWGAQAVLAGAGGKVYADVMDPEAKKLAPEEFGAFFREAITDCGRLVVLLSKETATSRWVPWELGVADGEFGLSHVAIWPVLASSAEDPYWAKSEYLNIYGRVEYLTLSGDRSPSWVVSRPGKDTYWRLSKWLELPHRARKAGSS